jgi:hypothetical protein
MKVPKQRCENCPARNNRVLCYGNKEGDRRLLCLECIAILNRIIREQNERAAA